MYFPLVLVVVLVALWLLAGIVYGRVKRSYGTLMMLGSAGVVAVAALSILLFIGPFWIAVYDTVIQPG